jgi:hypothetical protein
MSSGGNYHLPYPIGEVRAALPAAVTQATRRKPGQVTFQLNGCYFSTGVSWRTWGMDVNVELVARADGATQLLVATSLKFGLADWGEGTRIADRLVAALRQILDSSVG